LKVGQDAAETALKIGGEALEKAPEVIERSGQVVDGIAKAGEESKPVVEKVRIAFIRLS